MKRESGQEQCCSVENKKAYARKIPEVKESKIFCGSEFILGSQRELWMVVVAAVRGEAVCVILGCNLFLTVIEVKILINLIITGKT